MPSVVYASNLSGEETDELQSVSCADLTVSAGEIPNIIEDSGEDEESEVIKVVLPTEFAVLMYEQPGGEEMQIQSQDILVINKSDFPVNVMVKDIQYELTDKSAGSIQGNGLNLSVKEFQKEEYTISYVPGAFEPIYIGLDKARQETDAEQLMQAAEGWNAIGAVESGDYSILRLAGTIGKSDLSEDAVKVGVVFEFEKN